MKLRLSMVFDLVSQIPQPLVIWKVYRVHTQHHIKINRAIQNFNLKKGFITYISRLKTRQEYEK